MKRFIALLLVLPALIVIMGARRPEPMYVPLPTLLPEGITQAETAKVLEVVLVGRGWAIEKRVIAEGESPSVIVSTLRVRTHSVTIKLEFDKSLRISYVGSVNLGYKEVQGERLIHPKYTQWLKNIEQDFHAEIRRTGK